MRNSTRRKGLKEADTVVKDVSDVAKAAAAVGALAG
jgi:hypothetical protein